VRVHLAVLLAVAACGDRETPDRALGELVVAPKRQVQAIDVAKTSRDPAELGHALALPHHDAVTLLGPHTLAIKSAVNVVEGTATVDDMTTETTIEIGDNGSWRAVSNNTADYGREAIFAGSELYLRQRYGKWHRRPPTDDAEPTTLRDQYAAELAAVWDLVAPGAELTDRGTRDVAGRSGRVIEVRLDPSPRKPATEPHAQRKWRETRAIEALAGEIVLDAERGVPLSANLSGKIGFSRDGRRFVMTVQLVHEVKAIGQAVAIALPPPEETVTTPMRRGEVDDRDYLLKGIAPAQGRSGNPP
jgi:hypothetical protein